MNGISKRERNALLLAAAALAIGGPMFLMDQQAAGGGKGKSLAAVKTEQREVQARLARAREELEDLQGRVEPRLSPGTPPELVPRMIAAAQKAARASGMRLTDLRPMMPEEVSGLSRVPVYLTASARFPNAVRFLYELERQNGRLEVDQLRLLAAQQEGDQIELELRIVGFVRSEKKEDRNARRS